MDDLLQTLRVSARAGDPDARARLIKALQRSGHFPEELDLRIGYLGPTLAGKTRNLEWLHHLTRSEHRSEMCSVAREGDRTLFFDRLEERFTPRLRVRLATVPGACYYRRETFSRVLRGVDALVYLSVEYPSSWDLETYQITEDVLQALGRADVPRVYQWSGLGRDLATEEELAAALDVPADTPTISANPSTGEGVLETYDAVLEQILDRLYEDPEAFLRTSEAKSVREVERLSLTIGYPVEGSHNPLDTNPHAFGGGGEDPPPSNPPKSPKRVWWRRLLGW